MRWVIAALLGGFALVAAWGVGVIQGARDAPIEWRAPVDSVNDELKLARRHFNRLYQAVIEAQRACSERPRKVRRR